MTIETYLKEHKQYHCCELILLPNGEVIPVCPSHIDTMVKISNQSREEIDLLMPLIASPLHWLVDYTKSIAVYYNFAILPEEHTKKQIETLLKLQQAYQIAKQYKCQRCMEYQICQIPVSEAEKRREVARKRKTFLLENGSFLEI